jgi:hypothetical protein
MNYQHIEDPKPVVTKDFLVEIAKAIELIMTSGLVISGAKIDITLHPLEFERAFNHFSLKVPTNSGRPKKDFKINFSGVEVKIIKE